MIELLLSIFLGYRNGQIAKRKGKNTILWVIITVLAFVAGQLLGSMIVVVLFFSRTVDFKGAYTPQEMQKLSEEVTKFLMANPVSVIFIFFCGLGGYLLVHYLLSRMPDPPKNDEFL